MRSSLTLVAAVIAMAAVPAASQTSPVGAGKAIAVAEKALSAQAVEVELDRRDARLVYEIELVRGGALYEARVDAQTGKLIASQRQRLESLWAGWFDKARLRVPARPLGSMVAALEAETGGRVDEASLDSEGGRAIYEIELTTAAGTANIAVDPATGQRLPAALAD